MISNAFLFCMSACVALCFGKNKRLVVYRMRVRARTPSGRSRNRESNWARARQQALQRSVFRRVRVASITPTWPTQFRRRGVPRIHLAHSAGLQPRAGAGLLGSPKIAAPTAFFSFFFFDFVFHSIIFVLYFICMCVHCEQVIHKILQTTFIKDKSYNL